MPEMNNFFNELIQKDFFEKQASENESIKNALEDCSSSVLQKLAQELGALSEEKITIQQKLAETEECDEDEEDCEKDKEAKDCKSEEDEEETEAEEKEEQKEEQKEEEKEEETEAEEEDQEKEDEEAEAESDEDEEDDNEKEALERDAYYVAQEKLASSNMGVADFIFEKCANEHVAEYIAETAEKLACLCDKSALQIADEILDSVVNKLG